MKPGAGIAGGEEHETCICSDRVSANHFCMVFLIKGAVDIEKVQEFCNISSIVDMAVIKVPPNEPNSVGSK